MRLNVPVQGEINRSTLIKPYLVMIKEVVEEDGVLTQIWTRPTSDPNDPGPACRDSRGWHCQPVVGCVWQGIV
ncbi:hypothetical protein AB0H73_34525 [Streptomyces olivoreticuli]